MRNMPFILLLLSVFAVFPARAAPPALSHTGMKVQVAQVEILPGVSFDDAVESLKLRANQHNLKFVGASPLYKEIEALTGRPAKRMEIFSFCDGLVAQRMIEANPLMISFMPCRIALLEDKEGRRWAVAMMIDRSMIRKLPAGVRKDVERVMAAMEDSMIAAGNGDL